MSNLVDAGLTYWRALRSRAGIAAVVLSVLALVRVNRLVEFFLGELPPWASTLLGPWVSYLMVFIAGCLLTRAAMTELRRREAPTYEPLIWLRDLAKTSGWNWDDYSHVVSFAEWLRQGGVDESLILYGRTSGEEGAPLLAIPNKHWAFCSIPLVAIYEAESNDHMKTDPDNFLNGGLPYRDIHVNREPARFWLNHVARPQIGKTKTRPY